MNLHSGAREELKKSKFTKPLKSAGVTLIYIQRGRLNDIHG
jgi:hypothetical protein